MVAFETLIYLFKKGILRIDTTGSDMATESTLSSVRSQTDKITYDASNNLKINIGADDIGVAKSSDISTDQPRHITNAYDTTNDRFKIDVESTVNPPNLDAELSTLYTKLVSQDNSLTSINTKLPIFEELHAFTQITTTGASDPWSMPNSFKDFTIFLKNNGVNTAPQINIEGSLDNADWFTLSTSNTVGDDALHILNAPIKYMRINVINLGDATSIDCKALGVR
jgi:hypothetical protein